MKPSPNLRWLAIRVVQSVISHGQSLNLAQKHIIEGYALNPINSALVKALSYGLVRHYYALVFYLKPLIKKPLKNKDLDIQLALMLGAYQLLYMRTPDHAAIHETVEAVKNLKKQWATRFVNGVLRQLSRNKPDITTLPIQTNFPDWLAKIIKTAWPQHWQTILSASDQTPPMHLRINQQQTTTEDYLHQLETHDISATASALPHGITLDKATDVKTLPGFQQGMVSVQDLAAQQVVQLISPQPNQRILDACAAPGGKCCHILEQAPQCHLTAIDIDPQRCQSIVANLGRLQLKACVLSGDACKQDWWDGELYDTILIDAPCSGTGVIRRHPDIKLLRRDSDITQLAELQLNILSHLSRLLKPTGQLVYATCSIMPAENDQVIETFLHQNNTWSAKTLSLPYGFATSHGWQCLPDTGSVDGFYYAVLQPNHEKPTSK